MAEPTADDTAERGVAVCNAAQQAQHVKSAESYRQRERMHALQQAHALPHLCQAACCSTTQGERGRAVGAGRRA